MAPVALITGANRGIGLALAEELSRQGYQVVGTSRSIKPEDTQKEELREVAVQVVQLDVASEASIGQLAAQLQQQGIAKLDVLVNNAGMYILDEFGTVNARDAMTHFSVNTIGPVLVAQALHPLLKQAAQESGIAKIVQLSSTIGSITYNDPGHEWAWTGSPYAYRASKAALNAMNKCMSHDLAKDNITTVVVCPGYVKTDMTRSNGVIEPAESAAGLAKIIASQSMSSTGKFFYYKGEEIPW
ncbi:hypothetical protein RI367_004913 [Sorochytrium milnesiophthora]